MVAFSIDLSFINIEITCYHHFWHRWITHSMIPLHVVQSFFFSLLYLNFLLFDSYFWKARFFWNLKLSLNLFLNEIDEKKKKLGVFLVELYSFVEVLLNQIIFDPEFIWFYDLKRIIPFHYSTIHFDSSNTNFEQKIFDINCSFATAFLPEKKHIFQIKNNVKLLFKAV